MITISKLYFINSTLMIPTMGDPQIGSEYFYVALISTIFERLIYKETLPPLFKPAF